MNTSFKSKLFAAMLTAATASTMTIGHSLVVPAAAHAGVFGSVKSAATSVGSAASRVGSAVKSGAAGVKAAATFTYNKTTKAGYAASSAGGKVLGEVASVGKNLGSVVAKTYPARKIAIATKGIVYRVQH